MVNNELKKIIGKRLKQARNALGLTQRKLCEQYDIKLPSLRDYETCNRVPGGEAMADFMRAGINVNWLLTGKGPMLLTDLGKSESNERNSGVLRQINNEHAVYKIEKKVLSNPDTEWPMLAALAVSSADWLPDTIKQDIEAKITLAEDLFNFLTLYLGTARTRWEWIMEHKEVLQDALRFVYAINTLKNDEINEASNENSHPSNQ